MESTHLTHNYRHGVLSKSKKAMFTPGCSQSSNHDPTLPAFSKTILVPSETGTEVSPLPDSRYVSTIGDLRYASSARFFTSSIFIELYRPYVRADPDSTYSRVYPRPQRLSPMFQHSLLQCLSTLLRGRWAAGRLRKRPSPPFQDVSF